MNFLYFLFGFATGIILIIIFTAAYLGGKTVEKEAEEETSTVQFVDPVSFEEKFKNAKTVDDMTK